jgi:hypothetical protein
LVRSNEDKGNDYIIEFTVLRKNSVRAGKMMEKLILASLVSSPRDCPNSGASGDPDHHIF